MIFAIIGYLALQLGISYAASRFIRSEADYLVAGRSLGTFMVMFSLFATWFGAETVMASSGAVAAGGLSGGRADPFGYTLCLLLMGLLIAGALRARNYVTIGDFFREKYGRSNEVLASIIMIPTSIIWAAAQLQAFALILAIVSPLSVSTALMLAVTVVILYTWLGGLLGDVITDLVQGTILIAGLILLLVFVVSGAGGPAEALTLVRPEQLHLLSDHESPLRQFDVWLIPILGSLVAPEAISRTLAARSPQVARRACFWGAGLYFLVGLIPVIIALVGTHLIPPVAEADAFLPALVSRFLPPWLAVLFLGALVSAILSTIDSTLLSVAGLASRNVLLPLFKSPVAEKTKVRLSRSIVIIAGLIAYGIATAGESIYSLVETASSFGSAGFLVCLLGGLFLRQVSGVACAAILISGVALSAVLDHVLAIDGAFLFTVFCCATLYATFGLIEKYREDITNTEPFIT